MLLFLNKSIKTLKKIVLAFLIIVILKIIFYEITRIDVIINKESSEQEEIDGENTDKVEKNDITGLIEYIEELEGRYRELNEVKIEIKCQLSQNQEKLEDYYDKYKIIQELIISENEVDIINRLERTARYSLSYVYSYYSVLEYAVTKRKFNNAHTRLAKAVSNYYDLKFKGNTKEAVEKVEKKLRFYISKITEINHEILKIDVNMKAIMNEIDSQKKDLKSKQEVLDSEN
jgi:hypothetical protein